MQKELLLKARRFHTIPLGRLLSINLKFSITTELIYNKYAKKII